MTIHSAHYAWEPGDGRQPASFVTDLTGRMGADSLTPRGCAGLYRAFKYSPARQSFETLVKELEIRPADSEADIEADFAEFEL